MEVFLVYLWLKLDTLLVSFFVLAISGTLLFAVYSLGIATEGNEAERETYKKIYPRFLWVLILLWSFIILTPSSKDTAILVATSYATDFAKSPEGAKISALIQATANKHLDVALEEVLKPKK